MAAKLIVAVVMIPFDRRFFDYPVHSLDLPIGSRMVWLGQPMFDPICVADQIKPHLAKRHAVAVARLLCKLDAIVGENGVDFVRNGLQQVFKELPGCFAIGFLDELGDRELVGSVNGDKEIKLSFLGSDLDDIDMEITNGVALELLPFGLIPIHIG